MPKTHYQTLGVPRSADRESIKAAYYDLRKQFAKLKRPTQPQKDRLVRINAAWDVLKVAARKAAYDAELPPESDPAAGGEQDADEHYQESLRRTAAARKAAADAAAAAAERRADAAAQERVRKRTGPKNGAPPPNVEPPPSAPRHAPAAGIARFLAMGAGFAVAYFLLSTTMHTAPAAPAASPTVKFVEATEPPPTTSVKLARRQPTPHKAKSASRHRASSQSAADLNRLELARLNAGGRAVDEPQQSRPPPP